jgi:hypothetical protein
LCMRIYEKKTSAAALRISSSHQKPKIETLRNWLIAHKIPSCQYTNCPHNRTWRRGAPSVCVRAREVLPPRARESRASIIKRWRAMRVCIYNIRVQQLSHVIYIPCFNTSNSGEQCQCANKSKRETHAGKQKISSAPHEYAGNMLYLQ